jgi:band 4.1-like protein 4A
MAEKQFDKLRPEIKSISIPQPAESFESPYRSTCSIPASLSLRHNNNHSMNNNNSSNNNNNEYSRPSFRAPDSPRSTKSAPWMRSQQRGLFGITSSPKSVRSASALGGNNSSTHRIRSSSVESRSSVDSKSGKRHRRRSRRTSDNESELSRDSTRSGRSHNSHRKHRRHRSKHRRNDSASEHHLSGSHSAELVDSNHQWREVQRRQVEVSSKSVVQQASVMKSNQIASSHGSTDYHTHRSRKHRSKHRSPTDRGTKAWSNELARHLQFDLVDTTGMSEDQLREIPYTVVETAHAAKRSNFNSLKVHKTSQNVDRVDRIRR